MRDPKPKARMRCAIYTRKSTEDGLEQEYNSLEAQRDACASYILSQRHEGWTLLSGRYDDGGFSGGTMERPALKRLLAASKRRGLWMGGPVPLGYEVRERKLVVNEAEAKLVRYIFERYLALPSVNALLDELAREGHRTKVQARTSGPHKGGCVFRRGTLYHLLANRIYRGLIVHKGDAHPGEHEPIVAEPLWAAVQDKLAARGPGLIVKRDTPHRSLLVGMLYDGLGRAMTPTHACMCAKRYRYYVTRETSPNEPAWRTSAHDLEKIVVSRIVALLTDRNRISRLAMQVDPRLMERASAAAYERSNANQIIADLPAVGVDRIDLHEDRLAISISGDRLLRWCGIEPDAPIEHHLLLEAPVRRVRRGMSFGS